jgi:hypothetical protein
MSLLEREFEGGAIRQGGGFVGGGFGLVGAAEGMAVASLLNSLATKTSVQTLIRFEAEDAEVFCFTDQALPRDLQMRLAEVRGKVKASPPTHTTLQPKAGEDLPERLLRLGEMLDKGQLTTDEFAQAKARLLD